MGRSGFSVMGVVRSNARPARVAHQAGVVLSAGLLVAGVIVFVAPAAGAQGNTYYVGNVAAGSSGSVTDCSSNTNTDCTLDDAVAAFNNDSSGVTDTIDFIAPSGTYGTLGAGLTNSATLVVNGNGATNTLVTGAGANQVFVINSGAVVSISGLTVEHGAASGAPGAGILNSGTLTLTNAVVTGNHGTGMGAVGGGIANLASLTLTGVTVSNNAAGSAGGGIANMASLTLTNVTVSNNTTAGAGGGIASIQGARPSTTARSPATPPPAPWAAPGAAS